MDPFQRRERLRRRGQEEMEDVQYRLDLTEIMESDEESSMESSTAAEKCQDTVSERDPSIDHRTESAREEERVQPYSCDVSTICPDDSVSIPENLSSQHADYSSGHHERTCSTEHRQDAQQAVLQNLSPYLSNLGGWAIGDETPHRELAKESSPSPLVLANRVKPRPISSAHSFADPLVPNDHHQDLASLESFTRDLPTDPQGFDGNHQYDVESISFHRSVHHASSIHESEDSAQTTRPVGEVRSQDADTTNGQGEEVYRESVDWDRLNDIDFNEVGKIDKPKHKSGLFRKTLPNSKSLDRLTRPKASVAPFGSGRKSGIGATIRQRLNRGAMPSFISTSELNVGAASVAVNQATSQELWQTDNPQYHSISARLRLRVEVSMERLDDSGNWITAQTSREQL